MIWGTTIFGNTLIAVLMEHNPTPPKVYIKPDLRRHGNVTISIVRVAIKTVSYRVAYPSYIWVIVMPITYVKLTQGTIEVNMLHTRKKNTHQVCHALHMLIPLIVWDFQKLCVCFFFVQSRTSVQCREQKHLKGKGTKNHYLAIAIYTLPYCLTSVCEVKLGQCHQISPSNMSNTFWRKDGWDVSYLGLSTFPGIVTNAEPYV